MGCRLEKKIEKNFLTRSKKCAIIPTSTRKTTKQITRTNTKKELS